MAPNRISHGVVHQRRSSFTIRTKLRKCRRSGRQSGGGTNDRNTIATKSSEKWALSGGAVYVFWMQWKYIWRQPKPVLVPQTHKYMSNDFLFCLSFAQSKQARRRRHFGMNESIRCSCENWRNFHSVGRPVLVCFLIVSSHFVEHFIEN